MTQLSTSVSKSTAAFGKEKVQLLWLHERDSPKLHIWCVHRRSRGISIFSFREATVKDNCRRVILQGSFSPALRQSNHSEPSFCKTEHPAICFECATVTEWPLHTQVDWLNWTSSLIISFASCDPIGLLYMLSS
jgi:hypothetical protein